MSSTSIRFSLKVNGVLRDAESVVLSSADGAYGVKTTAEGDVLVADATPMIRESDGVYAYEVAFPDAVEPVTWAVESTYNGVLHRFDVVNKTDRVGSIEVPVFEHVPIVIDRDKADVTLATIEGLSTKHGVSLSDRGRLYIHVDRDGDDYRVRVYSDAIRTSLILAGSTASLDTYFDLDAQNASGMSGRAVVTSYTGEAFGVLIPTFAVDSDVVIQPAAAETLPGFDAVYGLAFVHAQQQRAILLGELPAAVPHLFESGSLAAFVPNADDVSLPDLTKIANVDLLRVAQANLVKAAAAEQHEHLEEFADIAAKARARFDEIMARLKAANPSPSEQADQVASTFEAHTFLRG